MRISKKILAAFLAALMAISMMPFTVFAAPPGSNTSGTDIGGGISIGGGSTAVGEGSYLTFTGTESFSIQTKNSTKNWSGTLEYSTDTNTWTTWDGTSEISSNNNVLYLRGTGNTRITGSSSSKYWVITTQGTVACSGDIRTLLDYTEPESSSMGTYCFAYLFQDCTSLTAAPELPATILSEFCYQNMFAGCTSLTMAPELEATSLARYCYNYMFGGCTSLTTAPELPATTLTDSCYQNMFDGCTSLTTAPQLPATELESHCYQNMFNGCESLTTAPVLPATILAEYCYYSMFNGCRSLTTAPALPATMLAEYCYQRMFQGCANLTTAPVLPATTLAFYCYSNMFNGCAKLTTAPALPATTLTNGCYNGMFQGCTSLTTPSALPATTLTSNCYNSMFKGCTGIKLSTTQTAEYSTPYSIPKQGTGSMGTNTYNVLTDMFTGTGGTFTGTPSINTTYYIPAPAVTGVAEVNGVGYATLEEAITAAQNGDTITLLDDVTGNFTIPAGLDVSLDLNGHTITSSNSSTPVITNRGTLNVYGGTLVNSGTYFPPFLGDGCVAVMNYGVATVNVTTNKGVIVNRSTSSTTPNLTIAGGSYVGSPLALSSENNSYTAINGGNFTGGSSFVTTKSGATTEVNGGNFACLGTESESNWIVNGGNVNAITVDENTSDISITVTGGEIKSLPSTSIVSQATNVSVEVSGGSFDSVVPAEYCADGYVPVTEPDANGKYTVETNTAAIDEISITTADEIDVNLYLGETGEEATVEYTFNTTPDQQTNVQGTKTVDFDSLPEVAGKRKLTIRVAPAQIRDNITIIIKNAAGGKVRSYENASVAIYCNILIAGDYSENIKTLAKSVLDYGKAAANFFGYNESAFANQANNFNDFTFDTTGWTAVATDITIEEVRYVATSVPSLRFKVDMSEADAERYTVETDKGYKAEFVKVGEDVILQVTGIPASKLGETITVSVKDAQEDEIATIQYTPIIYAYNASKANNVELARLGKTIGQYSAAAKAVFA